MKVWWRQLQVILVFMKAVLLKIPGIRCWSWSSGKEKLFHRYWSSICIPFFKSICKF